MTEVSSNNDVDLKYGCDWASNDNDVGLRYRYDLGFNGL